MSKDIRDPREIIDHIITSRVALSSAVYGLSTIELMTRGVVGSWSIKDVMAHIGRWEEICFDQLQKHLRGELSKEDYRDAPAYNDLWEAELQSLTLPETIELFETSHYRLFGLLSSLKSEQWNGYVRAWVRGSTWHHFEEHGKQIRAWRSTL